MRGLSISTWHLSLQPDALGYVLQGSQEHHDIWEQFCVASRQQQAAEAAQESALHIAELQNKLHALYSKLVIAAEGALLSVAASLASSGSSVRLSIIIAPERLPLPAPAW